jgi:peptide/nickel transport system substrate-binding protein
MVDRETTGSSSHKSVTEAPRWLRWVVSGSSVRPPALRVGVSWDAREGLEPVGLLRKRFLTVAAAAVAGALVLTACNGGGSGSGGGGTSSGPFRIGSGSTIDSLNPFVAFNQLSYDTFLYNYPSLVQYDGDLKFTEYLAKSWTTSKDGKTWTFVTNSGKWSDGQALDATDAAWTYNLIVKDQAGGAANWAGTVAHLTKAEAPDATTLVLTYDSPVANVLSQLEQIPILPEQYWGQYDTGKDGAGLKTAKVTVPMIAGGPFQVVGYTPKDVIQFKTNPNYFGTKPHIPGFAVQMYSDTDAMITAFKKGDLDYVDTVPAEQVQSLSTDYDVSNVQGVEWHDLIINSSPNKTTHPELQNLQVREAFEYAVNRQDFIDTLWKGAAQPGGSIVPPATSNPVTPWSDPSIKPLPYSPDKANQILDGLGYKKDSSGIRVANGQEMSYEFIVPSSMDKANRVFQLFQQDFAAIGVKIDLKLLDDTAAFNAMTAPDNTYANFDMAYWDWVPLIDPDFILSVLTCNQYGNWSDTGYCNKTYDQLYQKQASQVIPQDRLQTVYQMQQMIAKDRPYVVLAYNNAITAVTKQWTGLVSSPQGPFNSLSTLSLINVHQA